jgi:hypothetical protein
VATSYLLDPEVSGGLGQRTDLDPRTNAYPVVKHLHFEFAGWLGDDLVTTHPVYLVTTPLASALRNSGLSGFVLTADLDVTSDEQLRDLQPGWRPPSVEWLMVSGVPGIDDFGLTENAGLVVSSAALAVLRRHRMDHCGVRVFG